MSLQTGLCLRTGLDEGMCIDWFAAIDEVFQLLLDGVFTTSLNGCALPALLKGSVFG